MTTTLNEEEQIAADMAALDQTGQEPDQSEDWQDSLADPEPPEETPGSPTLDGLAESRRPKAKTACETCPNSVWFASPTEVKCYCRVMFLITWSTQSPNQITLCDGIYLGQE